MPVPFGPQLIGQTEKSLDALLAPLIADRVTEREWVTLRLAHAPTRAVAGQDDLAAEVADRARFADAADLVAALTARGLLAGGVPTTAATTLVAEVQARIDATVGPIWAGLDPDDVAATERVLNEVLCRARSLLAS